MRAAAQVQPAIADGLQLRSLECTRAIERHVYAGERSQVWSRNGTPIDRRQSGPSSIAVTRRCAVDVRDTHQSVHVDRASGSFGTEIKIAPTRVSGRWVRDRCKAIEIDHRAVHGLDHERR